MSMDIRLALLMAVVVALYGTLAVMILRRILHPTALKVFYVLMAVEAILPFLHLLTREQHTFWDWFFNPSAELALDAAFSAGQYVVVALITFMIGAAGNWPKWWQRPYWFIFAGFFAFLGLDEYFTLHETVLLWRYMYPLAGVIFITLTLIAFWTGFRRDRSVMVSVIVGLAIMGFAGVGLDTFANSTALSFGPINLGWLACRGELLGIGCQRYGLLEEFLEKVGVTLILVTTLSYVIRRTNARGWHLTRRLVMTGVALWAAWAVSNVWLIPTARAQFLAAPARAEYLDGDLQLLGYQTSQTVARPGDTINVTLYFRANRWLSDNYYLSVHLLSHPEVESVAQFDLQLGEWAYPTSAWIPGFAEDNTVELTLPDDLPTPASYWLMARVWIAGDDLLEPNPEGLPITETDRPLVTPDSLVVFSLPVLSDEAAPPPPAEAAYTFSGDFTLTGYALPERAVLGGSLPLEVWWQTGPHMAVSDDLTQFVHLFHSNGEDYYVYDRQPFDGRFPTSDWPPGIDVVDRFSVPLPDDLPPGEYRVQTGLYEPENHDRIPVVGPDGSEVTDYSILLGTVIIDAGNG